MNRAEILQFLTLILQEKCKIPVVQLTENTHLLNDLKLDSVALLTLSVEIENQLEIILLDDPESPPTTVKEIIDLVAQSLKELENQ
ncbi:MAG: acyl carrier protein [Planctomycetota bacterium]|nr:acyl carrier protein [Planctomycetota bacterium]